MFKKMSIHWWVLISSTIVLLLVASVLTAILLFVGKSTEQLSYPPQVISDEYAKEIEALRASIRVSEDDAISLMNDVEETLLRVRVPQAALDTHLAAVIQLQTLKRSVASGATQDTIQEELLYLLSSL